MLDFIAEIIFEEKNSDHIDQLFNMMANSKVFLDASIILFLNKTDIFAELCRRLITIIIIIRMCYLSSPRAKRVGPKGLRAESARAFTGRRNSCSGRGEDFLSRQPNFFTETAVTPERKVEKSFPRWEINSHAKG